MFSGDTFSLLAVCLLLAGLLCFKPSTTKELFAGMTFPMSYKISREVNLPPSCDKPAETFAVSGNYQSSLPPRFSNTQYRTRIRSAGMPRDEVLSFDPDCPLLNRNLICGLGGCEVYKPPVCGRDEKTRACSNAIRPDVPCCGVPTPCAPCAPCGQDRDIHHALPVTDMRTVQCMASAQDPHKQSRIIQAAQDTCHLPCKEAAECPVVYDRLIYANARSKLRSVGTDWIRGDLSIVPVLPESNPESLVWGRPSVTPHLDLNRGAMHVLGGYDNASARSLESLMNASVNGTLSTFGGIPLRNQIVTCDGNTDVEVSAYATPA
jgi:hypothetical protein